MAVQTGNVFAAYIYQDADKPRYRHGNSTLIAVNLCAIAVFLLTKLYYVIRNREKERAWAALGEDQRTEYRKNTTIQGSRRMDFRFAH